MLAIAAAMSYVYFFAEPLSLEVPHSPEAPLVEKPSSSTSTTSASPVEKTPVVKTPVASVAKANGSLAIKPTAKTEEAVAPGPLRVVKQLSSSAELSVRGIVEYTNGARSLNGNLPALIENELLDRDAQIKLADMFANQYFEHVSPSGVAPADLAQRVGYAYVLVGENLALGDFSSDQDVVTAWMNSPGHRANILNSHYEEIGVAVGKGMYEGRMTWIAVQSFGMPLSSCPATDANLKAQIDANNTALVNLRTQLDVKKAQIDATSPSDPNYNIYVGEFNAIVPQYNALVETNRTNVATYNAGVQAFNNCIALVGTH